MPDTVLMRSTPSLPVFGMAAGPAPRGFPDATPSPALGYSLSRIIELVCQLERPQQPR